MALSARNVVVRRGRFRLTVDELRADASGTALLGPNGSGKTTLLLALQDLLPYEGSITRTGRCAGVFAQPAVLRGSVLWNVAVVARAAAGSDVRACRARAEALLLDVGLADAMQSDARKLSSGQRQRLAVARALVLEPQLLFLDEPFANIDADGRPALRELVASYVERSGCALVLATQNLADVSRLCARVMLMENGRSDGPLDARAIGASGNPYLRALIAESRVPL